jgi:transposase IS66-like protein
MQARWQRCCPKLGLTLQSSFKISLIVKLRTNDWKVLEARRHWSQKNWMFAGSQRGGNSMAIAFTLTETAKLNNVDPQAWLTWVLAQNSDHKINRLDEHMPWRYAAMAA